jgi:hypothetical protein
VGIRLKNNLGDLISRSYLQDYSPSLESIEPGKYKTRLVIPKRILMPGQYQIEVKIFRPGMYDYFKNKTIQKTITVHEPKEYNVLNSKSGTLGYFLIPTEWDSETTPLK